MTMIRESKTERGNEKDRGGGATNRDTNLGNATITDTDDECSHQPGANDREATGTPVAWEDRRGTAQCQSRPVPGQVDR